MDKLRYEIRVCYTDDPGAVWLVQLEDQTSHAKALAEYNRMSKKQFVRRVELIQIVEAPLSTFVRA